MQIPKPSDQDKEFFRSLIPDDPTVEVKPMFGNLGAFANRNMFAGLFGPTVGVKLDEAQRAELTAIDGVGPCGPAERPMGGYLALPDAWRTQLHQARPWIQRALEYVSTLPPKPPRRTSRR